MLMLIRCSAQVTWDWGLVDFAIFFNPMNSIIFVLFDKYCSIVDQLDSKDSSRDFQLNCAITYFFYLYLIDVMERVKKLRIWR